MDPGLVLVDSNVFFGISTDEMLQQLLTWTMYNSDDDGVWTVVSLWRSLSYHDNRKV